MLPHRRCLAVCDHRSQLCDKPVRHALDRRGRVQVTAVAEVHDQSFAADAAVDIEHVPAHTEFAVVQPARFTRSAPARIFLQHLPKLAQVVEADFHLFSLPQPLAYFRASQISQRAIAHSLARDPAQLLLHTPQRFTYFTPAPHLDHCRIQTREPAHRLRHVNAADFFLLASVTFQAHYYAFTSYPLAQHASERRQQHVVDLRVIHTRHFLQQRPRLFRAQTHSHTRFRVHRVRALKLARYAPGGSAPHAFPVLRLLFNSPYIFDQRRCPLLITARLCAPLRFNSSRQCRITRL